jgi:thymidylate synthase ThyX
MTASSAIPFIRGLLVRGHESVIEHWRACFRIEADAKDILKQLVVASPLLRITQPILSESDEFVVSGNARMFRQLIDYASGYPLACQILSQLWEKSELLFSPDPMANPRYDCPPCETIQTEKNLELWSLFMPEGLTNQELQAHGSATFYLHGVSRALTHQLVRHRMASYSQASQRYCREDAFDYVTPHSIQDEARDTYQQKVMGDLQTHYQALVTQVPKEDARYVLPNATCTELAVTMTFENWMNFFSLRCDPHAQWEIRELAEQIRKVFVQRVPQLFC